MRLLLGAPAKLAPISSLCCCGGVAGKDDGVALLDLRQKKVCASVNRMKSNCQSKLKANLLCRRQSPSEAVARTRITASVQIIGRLMASSAARDAALLERCFLVIADRECVSRRAQKMRSAGREANVRAQRKQNKS